MPPDSGDDEPSWAKIGSVIDGELTITPGFLKFTPSPPASPASSPTIKPSQMPPYAETFVPSLPTWTPTHTATQTITQTPTFDLCSPLAGYPRKDLGKIISEPYDPPPPGSDDRHQGVDFTFHRLSGVTITIDGVGVQSVLSGKVAAAIEDSFPYGNFVIIETRVDNLPNELVEYLGVPTDMSLYLLYAHMQSPLKVRLGQRAITCQQIGSVGHSGNTEASHLHFETRLGPQGIKFNNMSAYVKGVTPEERANYVLWRKSGVFQHFDPMKLLIFTQ